MFSGRRVAKALSPLGFFLAVEQRDNWEFVRANPRARVFEKVSLFASTGRNGLPMGYASGANVCIALTPGTITSPNGMSESECLLNTAPADYPEETSRRARGWTKTETKEQAVAWSPL